MEKEKISVVIPTYNREKSILASVNSVLNQTYKNIEVIVVDDGSKDKTEELIKTIDDPRLKYIKLDSNHGACYARNVGIKESTGKYIAFQDSDDTFRENKLESQLNNLKDKKSDMDFCQMELHIENTIHIFPSIKKYKDNSKGIIDILCTGNVISTQTILAKKEIFNDVSFDESLPRLQDYDLVLRIAPKYKISYLKEVLVDTYRNEDNISNDDNRLKKASILMIKKDYELDVEQNEILMDILVTLHLSKLLKEKDKTIQSLYSDYSKLNKEYKIIEKDYRQIINSKRWKLINMILKNKI